MRRAFGLALLLGLLAAPGWAQVTLGQGGIQHDRMLTGIGPCTTTSCTFTAPILLPDGAVGAAPSLAFTNSATTGIYLPAVGQLGFAANGTAVLSFTSAQAFFSVTTLSIGSATRAILVGPTTATLQFGSNAATATAQTLQGPSSTGAGVTGGSVTIKAGAGTSGDAAGGQLILAGGANAGAGEPGAVQFVDGGTKPTCDAARRFAIWADAGGAGVADTFEVCAKQAAGDSYAWRVLATIP